MNFRKLCFLLLIPAIFLTSCFNDDDNNEGEILIDYAGSALYFINNKVISI